MAATPRTGSLKNNTLKPESREMIAAFLSLLSVDHFRGVTKMIPAN